jgi:hypothetical protein
MNEDLLVHTQTSASTSVSNVLMYAWAGLARIMSCVAGAY